MLEKQHNFHCKHPGADASDHLIVRQHSPALLDIILEESGVSTVIVLDKEDAVRLVSVLEQFLATPGKDEHPANGQGGEMRDVLYIKKAEPLPHKGCRNCGIILRKRFVLAIDGTDTTINFGGVGFCTAMCAVDTAERNGYNVRSENEA